MTILEHINQIASAFGDPRCDCALVWAEINAAAEAARRQEAEYSGTSNPLASMLSALEEVAGLPGFEPHEAYGIAVLSAIERARSDNA